MSAARLAVPAVLQPDDPVAERGVGDQVEPAGLGRVSSGSARTTTGSPPARSLSGLAGLARASGYWSVATGDPADSLSPSFATVRGTRCGAGPKSKHGSSATNPRPSRTEGQSSRRTSWPSSTTGSICGSAFCTLPTLRGAPGWQRRFRSAPDVSCAQWLYRALLRTDVGQTPDGDPLTDPPSGFREMHEHASVRRGRSARRGITEADHRAGRLFEVSGIRLRSTDEGQQL